MKAQISDEWYKEFFELSMDKRNFERLDEKEEFVIRQRFGTNKEMPKTYREIGLILNLGPERIRQILCKAIRKMKNTKRLIKEGGLIKK